MEEIIRVFPDSVPSRASAAHLLTLRSAFLHLSAVLRTRRNH
jgi:hypothetical protein